MALWMFRHARCVRSQRRSTRNLSPSRQTATVLSGPIHTWGISEWATRILPRRPQQWRTLAAASIGPQSVEARVSSGESEVLGESRHDVRVRSCGVSEGRRNHAREAGRKLTELFRASVITERFGQPRSPHRRLMADSRSPSHATFDTKADAPTSKDRCLTSGSFMAVNTTTFVSGFTCVI